MSQVNEEINALVQSDIDGVITAEDRTRLQAHLDSNEEVRQYYQDCRKLAQAVDGLEQLEGQEELLAALKISALPLLDAAGAPLTAGELLEIFIGLRPLPPGFDLRISDEEAPALSAALAELLSGGKPWRQCREAVLEAYPAQKRQRRERFAEVMAGLRDYGAAEFDSELGDLLITIEALGMQELVASGPEALLERLRQGR